MKNQIAIIDYGMGNLHSVASALQHVAPDSDIQITSDHDVIRAADRVIFPGVGAIRDCVGEMRRQGIDELMAGEITSGKPILAICIGMQALMQHSEENDGVACLGHFPGEVKSFASHSNFQVSAEHFKVPHMGWNQVAQVRDHPLWSGIEDLSRFYFVHSFYVEVADKDLLVGECEYGITFTACLAKGNVFASQFHPEKSHTAGLQLLENFSSWDGTY